MATKGLSRREQALLRVLDGVYAAPWREAGWPDALADVSEFLGIGGSYLFSVGSDAASLTFSEFGSRRVDPQARVEYGDYYISVDPRAQPGASLPCGAVYSDETLAPRGSLEGTEILHDFLEPYDVPHTGGIVVDRHSTGQLQLSLVAGRRHGPFELSKLESLRALTPHISRSVSLTRELRALGLRMRLLEASLSEMRCGAMLVDGSGTPLCMNQVAENAVRREIGLRVFRGRVQAIAADADVVLRRQLRAAASGLELDVRDRAEVALRDMTGRVVMRARVVKLPDGMDAPSGSVLLLLEPLAHQKPAATEILMRRYGLTPAEWRVAVALLEGESVRSIADRNALSPATIRTHVKRILQKVGVRSQTAFVRQALLELR